MISVIFCTRKRTKSLIRLFNSIEKTCSDNKNVEIVLGIDTDDEETINFVNEYSKSGKLALVPAIDDRGRGYIDMHNRVNKLCRISKGKILMFPTDEYEFITKDWDRRMLSCYDSIYKDNIFWLRIEDEVDPGGNVWAVCLAISRDWLNITGHFGTCYHQDTEFNFVAYHVGREIDMRDIKVIPHHEVSDKTYQEGRIAADKGLLKGRTVWSRGVRANIAVDAIKLLKQIKKSEEQEGDIDQRIRALYLDYAKTRISQVLMPIFNPFLKILVKILHRLGIHPIGTINNIMRYGKPRNMR
jgi:hypothetical protein